MEPTHTSLDDVFVGVGEAARIAQLSQATIRRYSNSGKLAHSRTPGGQRRFRIEDVRAINSSSPVSGAARVAPAAAGTGEDAADESGAALVGSSGEAIPQASPLTSVEEGAA